MVMGRDKTQAEKKKEQLVRVARKAAATQALQYDPIVGFGMYKEAGHKLSELPTDYVQYLASTPVEDGVDFTHNGVNWTQSAKTELARRKSGGPIPTREMMPTIDEGLEEVKFPKSGLARAKVEAVALSDGAIDGASLYLLKDFITRKDKSVGLSTWLRGYAQEAARYGALKGTDVVSEWVEILLLDYRGNRIAIRVAKSRLTLEKIEPHG